MRLSPHFTLAEMTRSQAAARWGLDNTPDAAETEALRQLCLKLLEPIREEFGPVTITSGFRAPKVNAVIGGAPTSQHTRGQAADFEIKGVDNPTVASWIADSLSFDQLILEFYRPGDKNSGWLHASYKSPTTNRRQVLTASRVNNRVQYTPGLP